MRQFLVPTLLILMIAVGTAWGYFAWTYPSASLRYEVTVEVEADGQIYTGSGVHEVTLSRYPGVLILSTGTGVSTDFKGEAVAVDIADRGTLFLLLTGTRNRPSEPFSPDLGYHVDPQQLVNVVFDVRPSSAEAIRSLSNRVVHGDVPFNRLPMMVRFDDITDPSTIALVNPYDLSASFGEGVELLRVHIAKTTGEVTEGLDSRLNWLSRQRGSVRPDLRDSVLRSVNDGTFRLGFR